MARDSEFGLVTGAVQAGRAAMSGAGIGPADVTMCQIYDCYTYTVLVTLEDYGFCAKGEGGPFAASGALGPGGSLPVNTGGGQLSAYYMWGFTPLSEAIIQARGDGGDRQSPATDVILVSGNGGILSHHGTLIVSPHQRERPVNSTSARSGRQQAEQAALATPSEAGEAAHDHVDGGRAHDGRAHDGRAHDGRGHDGRVQDGRAWPAVAGPDQFGVVRADARSEPFFAAAAEDVLMVRRCNGCGALLAPTASGCPGCADDGELSWAPASGHGTLVSWSVVHPRNGGPVSVPALVEHAEGPWLSTGLVLAGPGELGTLHAGQPVAVEFVHPDAGASYPVFRPVVSSACALEQ
jgi:uncharacterized OB-fold protein